MKRTISTTALLFTSISAIIGSGWLFGAYYTATIAGPAAIISWALGGVFVIIVAFVFAEICGLVPVSGSSTRIPQYTHGMTVSFMFSWMVWLSYLALMATEVQAVIQYSSFYFPTLTYNGGGLTPTGYMTAVVLMFLVSFINTYSVRWLIRCNNVLTIIKLIIPTVIVAVILIYFFHPTDLIHPGGSTFMPHGIQGVLTAISSGGILFAFNGFKQAAEMAGEAKNPSKSVPIAIVGSVVICLVLFLLLQFAFLTSLTGNNLISGWSHLQLSHGNSPLASILEQDHFNALLPLLYFGAIVAPLAAGLMYCSSAARSLYGMSKNGYLPALFRQLSPQGNPVNATIINFFAGLCLFAPLPGWDTMVAFLTSLLAITYAAGPVCMIALRSQAPTQTRHLRLPFGKLWAYVAFYICTLLAYWSGWDVLNKMIFALAFGALLLIVYRYFTKHKVSLNLREAVWMWPYFIGIIIFSYLGNGATPILSLPQTLGGIAIFCLIILLLASHFKLPSEKTLEYLKKLHLEGYEST